MKESGDPVTRSLVFKSKQNDETCPFVRWRPLHTTVQAQKIIHLSVISWIWCFCATKVLLKRIGTFQFIFAYGFHIWVHFFRRWWAYDHCKCKDIPWFLTCFFKYFTTTKNLVTCALCLSNIYSNFLNTIQKR